MKKIKKILSLFIATVMLGSFLTACGKETIQSPPPPPPPPPPIEYDLSFSHFPETQFTNVKAEDYRKNMAPTVYIVNQGKELPDDTGVIDTTFTHRNLFLAATIQGLFARDKVSFYIGGSDDGTIQHLNIAKERWGIQTVNVSLEYMIQMYIDNWEKNSSERRDFNLDRDWKGDPIPYNLPLWGSDIPADSFRRGTGDFAEWAATSDFRENGYSTPGYIVYAEGTWQGNVAATLAGITGFIPVSKKSPEQISLVKALGLKEKLHLDNDAFTQMYFMELVESELNRTALVHQAHSFPTGNVDPHVRDIGVAFRMLHTYYAEGEATTGLKTAVGDLINSNSPIYGYMFDEGLDVEQFSRTGQFFVPTDYSQNLSFLAAKEFKFNPLTGKRLVFGSPESQTEEITAENGNHYVAFVVSDGDNLGQWQINFPFSRTYMNAPGRENDDFSVTWGLSPSVADVMPSVYNTIMEDLSKPKDSYIAPVTGQGYANLASLLNNNPTAFSEYLGAMDIYLMKSGMNIVTAMSDAHGEVQSEPTRMRKATLRELAKVPSLKGGIMYEGTKYFSAVDGTVYWANGKERDAQGKLVDVVKPFIGPRDSLWGTNSAFLAARLNHYAREAKAAANPATRTSENARYMKDRIDSYSIINVHPWTHNYQHMRSVAALADDNVKFVSVEQLFDMVIKNVAPDKSQIDNDENVWIERGTQTRPMQSGVTLGDSWLSANSNLIETDPLKNEFLFHTEDWTASSGSISHSNTDGPARQEGFTALQRSIVIPSGATAKKASFILPDEDDLYVWFMARGNGVASTREEANARTARMRFTFTIDGVTKTIIEDATLRASTDSGPHSNSLFGDGWQYYGFPLKQYFSNYKGKAASASISCLGATAGSNGLKMTFFTVESLAASPVSGQPINVLDNQFKNLNTEDWVLGNMWLVTQYISFGAAWTEVGGKGYPFPNGSIRIDVSNGGGPEKRGTNSNVFALKTYTIPAGTTGFSWNIDGGDEPDWGAMYNISIYIGGKLIVIEDWKKAIGNAEIENPAFAKTWNFAVAGITITEATEVTVLFQARDSGDKTANGAGEKLFLRYWKTNVA